MLDVYCERAGAAGLWAEPLNALTNLAFLLAALLAARHWARQPDWHWRADWDRALLTLLLGAIGIGSGLWHLWPASWTLSADVIPIALFINLYLLSFGWRALRLGYFAVLGLWLSYQGVNVIVLTLWPATALNGSLGYVPALVFLAGFSISLRARQEPRAAQLAAATVLFALSLTVRTVDQAWCPWWPSGTHFLWHLLNALLLYVLITALPPRRVWLRT